AVADGHQAEVDVVLLADPLHLGEAAGVAGVVGRLAADLEEEAVGVAAVGAVRKGGGVAGVGLHDAAPVEVVRAAGVHRVGVLVAVPLLGVGRDLVVGDQQRAGPLQDVR